MIQYVIATVCIFNIVSSQLGKAQGLCVGTGAWVLVLHVMTILAVVYLQLYFSSMTQGVGKICLKF
jgi:hypothetical protein